MLYNPSNKQQLKNSLLVCLIIALLGATLSFVGFLRKDFDLLIATVACFSPVLSCFLLMSAGIWIIGQFRCEFCNNEIKLFWAKKCYRSRPYSEVKGITILGAVNFAYYPITDSAKKQIAIVSLYEETHIATMRISPNATAHFPGGEDYCICRTEFNAADLATIMRCSRATVFVSQEIFSLYSNELTTLFRSFPSEQAMISHWRLGCDRPVRSTYEEYLQGRQKPD